MTRLSYSRLARLETFEERFDYLTLKGVVGDRTFGGERWINQDFYRSREWRDIRHHVISRDMGCDLGVPGFDLFDKIIIHHMNPMTRNQIANADPAILDPEFLISVSHKTHNAIHYGDKSLLPGILVDRRPGDTSLWTR